jgi:hypothetical protein
MKLVSDSTTFDALQRHLLGELVASIRDGLREAGVEDGPLLFEATSNAAYAVAAIIDGSREMYLDDREVVPVLTFAREREGGELIAADSGGSWMHDYVQSVVEQHVSQDDDDGEFDESVDLGIDDEDR